MLRGWRAHPLTANASFVHLRWIAKSPKINLLLAQIEDHTAILDALRQKQHVDCPNEYLERWTLLSIKKQTVITVTACIIIALLSTLAGSIYHSYYQPANGPTLQTFPKDSPPTPKAARDMRYEDQSSDQAELRIIDNKKINEVSASDVESKGSVEVRIKPNNDNNRVSAKRIKADGNVSIGVLENSSHKESR